MARTAHDLVIAVVQRRTPAGVSIVIEGAPGIGKTFLARDILDSLAPEAATVVRVAGEQGRRSEPFAIAGQLLDGAPPRGDPGGVRRRTTASTSSSTVRSTAARSGGGRSLATSVTDRA